MTASTGRQHFSRLHGSAAKLAAAIHEQGQSLARFPAKHLDEVMVTYDLLAAVVYHALTVLTHNQPDTCDALVPQLADEVHVMIEEWRGRLDAMEEATAK